MAKSTAAIERDESIRLAKKREALAVVVASETDVKILDAKAVLEGRIVWLEQQVASLDARLVDVEKKIKDKEETP